MAISELSDAEKIEGLLHDAVAPHLWISRQQLELLMAALEESSLSDHRQAMLIKSWRSLQDGQTAMESVMAACKNAARDVTSLDDEALFPTVEVVITQFTPLLDLSVHTRGEVSVLMGNKKLGICLQELLTNTLKYSPKKAVTVDLRHDCKLASLKVISKGQCQPESQSETATAGTGLERLRQRLDIWGGQLCVEQNNSHFQVALTLGLE